MVARIEFTSPGVRIDGVRDLIVATLIQAAEIEPNLGDVWVNSDGARICVQGVTELIDLEVQHSNGAPECRVASVAIDGLLIRFVGLVILLPRHVGTTEEIPTLGIGWVYEKRISKIHAQEQQLTGLETLGKILYSEFLVLEGRTVLVVQPTKLLKNFGVSRIVSDDAFVSVFSADMLVEDRCPSHHSSKENDGLTSFCCS